MLLCQKHHNHYGRCYDRKRSYCILCKTRHVRVQGLGSSSVHNPEIVTKTDYKNTVLRTWLTITQSFLIALSYLLEPAFYGLGSGAR
jgi:hypothetical protein